MNRPLFSVVIPTRNRAGLLTQAIQSVLGQTEADFELVVSDNASSDGTGAAVQQFGDRRIRYFRANTPMSLGDSWEFALEKATGEFITFLSDDDLFVPQRLESVKPLLRERTPFVTSAFCHYTIAHGLVDRLVLQPFTGRAEAVESVSTLKKIYRRIEAVPLMPNLSNTIYDSAFIRDLRRKTTRFVTSVVGDMFAAGIALGNNKSYLCCDLPLTVVRMHRENASRVLSERGQTSEVGTHNASDYAVCRAPLKRALLPNLVADALLMASDHFCDFAKEVDLDWAQYFINCRASLELLRKQGVDVGFDELEWQRELARQPVVVQQAVRSAIDGLPTAQAPLFKRLVRKLICSMPGAERLELKMRPAIRKFHSMTIHAGKSRFFDIAECATFLRTDLLNSLAQFWNGANASLPSFIGFARN